MLSKTTDAATGEEIKQDEGEFTRDGSLKSRVESENPYVCEKETEVYFSSSTNINAVPASIMP